MTALPVERELSPLRIGRITGSRVAAVLGISPYATRAEVLREMVREHFGAPKEFAGNAATDWGRAHEPSAIAEYELTFGKAVECAGDEQVTFVHPEVDFIAATPDGLIGEDGLVEVKCPFFGKYTHIGQSPDHRTQIQLQLAVTGRKWADYVVWYPEGISVSREEIDPDWFSLRLPAFEDFIDEYRSVIADEELARPHLEPLVDHRTDEDWTLAEYDYLEALAELEQVQARVSEAKRRLIEMSGRKTTKGLRLHLVRNKPAKGSIAYQQALRDLAPGVTAEVLEMYRGSEKTESFTIRRIGEK